MTESRSQMGIQVMIPGHSVFSWAGWIQMISIPDKRSRLHQTAGRYQNRHVHISLPGMTLVTQILGHDRVERGRSLKRTR